MSIEAKLLNKIFEVTRGDLETARFSLPKMALVIDGMTLVRITRLASFWKNQENDERILLKRSIEDLIIGCYGQSCSWTFLLKGSHNEIECWFGASEKIIKKQSLSQTLYGSFPDIRFGANSFDMKCFDRLRHALILTGTPSLKVDQSQNLRVDQIEKICRGLYGSNWVYVVIANPVPYAETLKKLNDISTEIRDIHATFLLKTSATDEQNRVARRYVDLLEAKLKRWEQGRTSGMWFSHTLFLTDNISSLGRAKGLLYSSFSGEKSLPEPIRVCQCASGISQNPTLEPLNSMEIAILARPPSEHYPGYEIVDYVRFGVESNNSNHNNNAKTIKVGDILDRGTNTGNSLYIPLREITKHGLIAGVTGSGKTNTCFMLLDQIWDGGKGVPFLVVESAKSEYRSLLRNPRFQGLKIFTIGDETTSPLRLNPFEVPKGILLQTHIDYIKSLFSAAFVLYPPMPYVLEQSIQEIYEDRGWDLSRNHNSRGKDSERLFPILSDLAAKISVVIERMGYDERITMDVKAGLLARINQLRFGGGKGLMFNSRNSISPSVLFESPCLLELKQVVNDDEKAFIIGLILVRLYEYHEAGLSLGKEDLKHVTLIEEAHRLLRNVSTEQGNEVTANPKGRAIEVFANILSEIRAYGEGILIAEVCSKMFLLTRIA